MRVHKLSLYSQRREPIEGKQIGFEIRIKTETRIQLKIARTAARSTDFMCG